MIAGVRIKRWLVGMGTFLAGLLMGLVVSYCFDRWTSTDRVVRGVVADSVVLSGLNASAVEDQLAWELAQRSKKTVTFRLGSQELTLKRGEVGLVPSVEEVSKRALGAGRSGGLFEQFFFWFKRLHSPFRIEMASGLSREQLELKVSPWVDRQLPPSKMPSIQYKKELIVQFGVPARSVDFDDLAASLERLNLHEPTSVVEIALQEEPPKISRRDVEELADKARGLLSSSLTFFAEETDDEITLLPAQVGALLVSDVSDVSDEEQLLTLRISTEKLRKKLSPLLSRLLEPAKDASFEFSPSGQPTIVAGEPGRELDEEALVSAIWNTASTSVPVRRLPVPLLIASPSFSRDEAESLGVLGLVSSFTTRHACCQKRVKNIHRAAKSIDGVVLRPGEQFSLNDHLGPRTRAAGYLKAPTIVRGKMEETFGGGISQLATTLFNTVLRGGYEIVQRQPHSIYFSRYPEGHEATVSFPLPDLIFRNDTRAGMVLKTQYTGTFIKVLVYGNNEGRRVTRTKSKRYNIVQPPVEYEPDPEMDPDESRRLRAGQLGWTLLMTTSIRFADGTKKDAKREVVYNPRPEVLRVHPCRIPPDDPSSTGEECPEPIREEREEELSDEYFETTPGGSLDNQEEGTRASDINPPKTRHE